MEAPSSLPDCPSSAHCESSLAFALSSTAWVLRSQLSPMAIAVFLSPKVLGLMNTASINDSGLNICFQSYCLYYCWGVVDIAY